METPYYWMYSFPMKKGILDDDYYFYEDGRILHCYDKTQSKLNVEEYVIASSISEDIRTAMLQACPLDKKEIITKILQL